MAGCLVGLVAGNWAVLMAKQTVVCWAVQKDDCSARSAKRLSSPMVDMTAALMVGYLAACLVVSKVAVMAENWADCWARWSVTPLVAQMAARK